MQPQKFVIFYFLSILASCSLSYNQDDLKYRLNSFDVDEQALNEGVLRIYLPEEVPKNLAIQAPDGKWFVLQEAESSIEIMPQVDFESVNLMEFRIEELKGITWRESKRLSELVFKSPGNYLIYFADNLETEPTNTFNLQKSVSFKK